MSHGHISHRKAFRSVVFVPRRRSRRPVGRLPDDVAPAAADDMAQFQSERGFALPTTIFLVTFLTVLLATALARARSDHEVANSGQSVVDALAIAESGLQTYMDGQTSRPSDGDSVRINLTGGYADVAALVLQNPADQTENEYFVIRSTGYVIDPNQGATPIAERTVAQMALWQVGRISQIAALVAANGIKTSILAGINLHGDDHSTCSAPDIAGARLATQFPPAGNYRGNPPIWIGETADSVANETGISWQLITDGAFSYDYTDLSSMTDSSSYYIDGDLTLTANGEGLLIVTGDLTTAAGFAVWNGIILVGGQIIFQVNNNRFRGIVATGLNEQLGGPPVQKNMMNKKDRDYKFYYASCNVEDALKALTGLIPINNAWIDNWATY